MFAGTQITSIWILVINGGFSKLGVCKKDRKRYHRSLKQCLGNLGKSDQSNSMGYAKTLENTQISKLAASVARVKVHSCLQFIVSLASWPVC